MIRDQVISSRPARTRIKICGITSVEAAAAAVDAGADAIGLVFVEESPRHVDLDTACEIIRAIPAFVDVVGLFTTDDSYAIERTATLLNISTLQLHGEDAWRAAVRLEGHRLILAAPFDQDWLHYILSEGVDWSMLLVDAETDGDELVGGTGRTADWKGIARDENLQMVPFVLAGGLTPENVAEAIRVVRPWGVDVSSGVESSRGVKDLQKIKAFCDAVRNAE